MMPLDPQNPLFEPSPTNISSGMLDSEDGRYAVLCFRTASTTFTFVTADAEQLDQLAKVVLELRSQLEKRDSLIVPAVRVPGMNGAHLL